MSVTRRGFLGLLAGAVASAAAGIDFVLPEPAAPKLLARHTSAYNIDTDQFVHRIDVAVDGGGAWDQVGVDFTGPKSPSAVEMEPALQVLSDHIERRYGTRFEIDVRHVGSSEQFRLPKVGERVANG